MIDFHQLRQLVTIAEQGSLSAAAKKLHISQPALSRSMQRLETDLGLSLFERRRNRLIFRELGLLAVDRARSLLQDANRYVEDLHAHALQLSTVLIGSNSPGPLWRLSTEAHERFPHVILLEELAEAGQLLTDLRSGRLRLVLIHYPVREAGLLCREYMVEHLQLELPPGHPLCSRESLTLEDLLGMPVLGYRNVGIWRTRFAGLEGLHIIEQAELDVLEDLALSSGLPVLTSSSSPPPTSRIGGRVTLPILGETTTLPFYLCARGSDQDLFSRFC
jgi:DNA-binding transcriptional LysR family regulator